MKTKLPSMLILLFALTLANKILAQIPNAGFENWTAVASCNEPTGWHSLYSLFDSSGTYCPIIQSTDHYPAAVGNFSVRITNDTALWNAGTSPANFVGWGLLTSSTLNDRPLFPVSGHPQSLCGYYKFLPENGDTMNIYVHFYKSGIEITNGKFQSSATAVNWTAFRFFVADTFYNSVDSARITFSPCNEPKNGLVPRGNSVLYIDNLSFDSLVPTGFNEEDNEVNRISVYPDPASEQVTITFYSSDNKSMNLEIFNAFGQQVFAQQIYDNTKSMSLDISEFDSGLYFIRVAGSRVIYNKKIIVAR